MAGAGAGEHRGRRGLVLGAEQLGISSDELRGALLGLASLAEETWYAAYAELRPRSRAARALGALDELVNRLAVGGVPIPRNALEAAWLRAAEAEARNLVVGHLVLDLRQRIDLWDPQTRERLARMAADLAEMELLARGGLVIGCWWDPREHCIHLAPAAASDEDLDYVTRLLENTLGVPLRVRKVETRQHLANTVLYLTANHQHIYVPGHRGSRRSGGRNGEQLYAIEIPPDPRIIATAQRFTRAGWCQLTHINSRIYLIGSLRLLYSLVQPTLSRATKQLGLQWKPRITLLYINHANSLTTENTAENIPRTPPAAHLKSSGAMAMATELTVLCIAMQMSPTERTVSCRSRSS